MKCKSFKKLFTTTASSFSWLVINFSCRNFIIFCRTETRKNRAGEQKPRQKSQKKQQGHKKKLQKPENSLLENRKAYRKRKKGNRDYFSNWFSTGSMPARCSSKTFLISAIISGCSSAMLNFSDGSTFTL
jgi:hypothetical protein